VFSITFTAAFMREFGERAWWVEAKKLLYCNSERACGGEAIIQ